MQPDPQAAPPSLTTNRNRRPPRRILLFAVIAAAIVVAAVAAVPLVASFSWSPVAHYECGPGATVATREVWTPWVLVNAPYGGFGNGTGSLVVHSKTNTTASNGSALGIFELAEWAIAPSVRVLVAGPGANVICGGYLAFVTLHGGYAGAMPLQAGNATSNAGEALSVSFLSHDSVLFHNGYSEEDRSVSTCTGGGVVLGVTASRVAVEVPFILDGANHTASATLEGAFNYTYSFPGKFGTWSIDDLNAGADAPGGGWAFSFAPCS